uniref:Small ribosomal subunit protein uS4m n=1 Tax=Prototheca wickerhamii TaxID=3111 RepID=RT04_PROWI|nr:ribosomal protein S4 [Prototheca wickerhamii]P46743.1 RecName: Full=Small ribosomal subunit protein uS4m; AltName: Full=Ribosomal protein S4, mitochondrial [Prototheca wickerhamii]AAD12659.1 ribosomal protein S4 [Prototheca wickerhamii]
MKISLKCLNTHTAEIYRKCLLLSDSTVNVSSVDFTNQSKLNLLKQEKKSIESFNKNSLLNISNFRDLERQEKDIQKKTSKKVYKKSYSRSTKSIYSRTKIINERNKLHTLNQQIIFSTLARIHLKKKINLLFPVQEFLFELSKHRNKSAGSKSREYLEILLCVKKLKMFYGFIPLKQLHKILVQAKAMPGYFSKNFFSLIEKRLDVVLYRSGFTKTIVAARQACRHSQIYVNSKVCRIPSTILESGDIISYKNQLDSLKTAEIKNNLFSNINTNVSGNEVSNNVSNKVSNKISSTLALNKQSLLLLLFCAKSIYNESFFVSNKRKFKSNEVTFDNKKEITSAIDYTKYLQIKNSRKKYKLITLNNNLDSLSFNIFDKEILNSLSSKQNLPVNKQNIVEIENKKTNKFNTFSLLFQNLTSFSKSIESYSSVLALKLQDHLLNIKGKRNEVSKNINKIERSQKDNVFINILQKINRPTHLEISSITNSIIFLYSPQRIYLPFYVDIDILRKSL